MDYYKQIDNALSKYEKGRYIEQNISWICSRIDWCYRFRKITPKQKDELVERVLLVMNSYTTGYEDFS